MWDANQVGAIREAYQSRGASYGNAEGWRHLVQHRVGGVKVTRKIGKMRERTRLEMLKERKWKEQARRRAREAARSGASQGEGAPQS